MDPTDAAAIRTQTRTYNAVFAALAAQTLNTATVTPASGTMPSGGLTSYSKISATATDAAGNTAASITASCRHCACLVEATNASSVSCAESPVVINASPRGPKDVLANDWVATAPASACTHGTTAPTAGNLDATATPQACSSRSQATIENVITLSVRELYLAVFPTLPLLRALKQKVRQFMADFH